MFKRRPFIAAAAVCSSYVAFVVIVACTAQLQLIEEADPHLSKLPSAVQSVLLIAISIAIPIAIASGAIPAIALYFCGIRGWAAYLANAVVSALLGAYDFLFNFGIADNIGAILVPVSKTGAKALDGWLYRIPPFSRMLEGAFHVLPNVLQEQQAFAWLTLIAFIFSASFGGTFWSYVVRASDEQPDQRRP
ncbi:MAG TPA: hypothetical protein VGG10_09290 [Rhizomicrobium sp.]|jgi:hypothetical protein